MQTSTLAPKQVNKTASQIPLVHAYANMYKLLIMADGSVSNKEIEFGEIMIEKENLNKFVFEREMNRIADTPNEELKRNGVALLKKLPLKEQIRCMAWLLIIANSDGFVDSKEWQFLYLIFYKELNLEAKEIMAVQWEIYKNVLKANNPNFGIRVNN